MVGKTEYTGVPTSVDLENNSNQKKYTVNSTPKGHLVISKTLCALMALGALLLIALAIVATFFLIPSCSEATPEPFQSDLLRNVGTVDKRLPRSIEPLHYRLQLVPMLEGNFTTEGAVTISMKIKDDTRKIIFNVNDIEMDEQSLSVKNLKEGEALKIASKEYDAKSQRYTLTMVDILSEGEQYEMEIKFTGHLNDYMQGFYRSRYVTKKNETRWMASTQFSPTDARRAFPCFDEPSFKANFTISIARKNNMTSLSNMPIRETVPFVGRENWQWDHYQQTPPMSTYLVAFVVSDLQPFRYNSSDTVFTVWSRREAINQALFAADLGPKILQHFEGYFGIKFPLPKVDIVAVPDFGFTAMENWGLITFKEQALLFEERTSTIDNKREIATVMGHEIAHQWFGNLVTPSWWDDLWLKEGFATYFEYLAVDKVEPSWGILDEFPISEVLDAFKIDSLESSRPISFEVKNSNEIRQAFDAISYSKGASIIRMMNHILGEETFRKALIEYLNSHQYSNVKHDDLWEALTAQAHADNSLDASLTIKEIMDTWTLQPGFPLITANRNGKQVTVSQERFLASGKSDNSTLWHVPISYTFGDELHFDNTKPKVWLAKEEETSFTLQTNSWYLLNLKQTGYYIVNYDVENWEELIKGINGIPPIIRGQLVCDAMDLAKAGILDYDIALRIISAISIRSVDIPLVPITAAFNKLSFLKTILATTAAYGNFELFVSTSFHREFSNTGLNEKPSDSYALQKKRRVVLDWACMKSDSRCTITSRQLYRTWMTDDAVITPNIRDVVYCTAIREGGEPEWKFAYQQYLKTNLASEKNILLDAMGCSSKPWILSKYLDMMLTNSSGIRKHDGLRVFKSVADNIVGHYLAFDFLRTNWKEINEFYGNGFNNVAKMVESLPKYMNTPFQLSQLQEFKTSNANNLGVTQQAFDRILEVATANVEWMDKNYKPLETWLEDYAEHYERNRK